MTTGNDLDFSVDSEGTVHVCAWCWPMRDDIIRRYPELKGCHFTHGVCQRHAREVLQKDRLARFNN